MGLASREPARSGALEPVPRAAVAATDWDAVVDASDDGWPFALHAWQSMITAVERWGFVDHSFALREGNGRLLAVMPLQWHPAAGAVASSAWGGAGPIVVAGLSQRHRRRVVADVLARALSIASTCGAARFEFWLSPASRASLAETWGVNPYVFHGCRDLSGVSQLIDLSEDEALLWRGLSETARQMVTRARRAGLEAVTTSWGEALTDYWRLHCETYERTGVAPHPRPYFEGIARVLGERGLSLLHVVRNAGGEALAFHNTVSYHGSACYHTGCSSAEALANGANYLLFWHAICEARRRGARWYDCGEIAPDAAVREDKLAGLTRFKTAFGGRPHRFFRCEWPLAGPGSATAAPVSGGRLRRWFGALRR